ncbi:MAG: Gfo/Idh/MocA family oxidoreductase [Abditibacteriota bacterium]|nr:Gfo/Idh/MocA family oxidoreductase [Abditibacteriota bacterium]
MKLAIIGTGKIVPQALYAMEPLKEISLEAIFARPHSREKGGALAREYSIPRVYTDYEKLLAGGNADTVYIALVNSVHYEYAKKALEAGKNVILEKPFTGTYREAEELFRLARERDLYIFEAVTVLHSEIMDKLRENLPRLGHLRMMIANYSQYSGRYDRYLAGDVDPYFDPAYLGGALRDINVYNLHYAAALFGAPKEARYFPNRGFNGVDISGAVILDYGGFRCVCIGAKDSDSPCFVSVQGEKGWMRIDGKPNSAQDLTIAVTGGEKAGEGLDNSGASARAFETEVFVPRPVRHRMTAEFEDFARIIAEKDRAEADRLAAETLDVMKIIDGC